LIDDTDRTWFNELLKEMLMTHLNTAWEVEEFGDILFGDYMTRDEKQYQMIKDKNQLHELLVEYLEEYNITFPSQMHLVFFQDAINHISRICRIIRQPRGNALLVGVGGSGRQSLSRLASFMADFKLKSIEITRGYGSFEFHEDLKGILMSAGADNQPTVFLFSDTQIVKVGEACRASEASEAFEHPQGQPHGIFDRFEVFCTAHKNRHITLQTSNACISYKALRIARPCGRDVRRLMWWPLRGVRRVLALLTTFVLCF